MDYLSDCAPGAGRLTVSGPYGIGWGLNETEPKNSSIGGETVCATFSLLLVVVVGEKSFICWWWGDLVYQIYLQLNIGPGINTSVSKDVMATSSTSRHVAIQSIPIYLPSTSYTKNRKRKDALKSILPKKPTASPEDMKVPGIFRKTNHK